MDVHAAANAAEEARCLTATEAALVAGKDSIAAVIVEPVQAEVGLSMWSPFDIPISEFLRWM